MRIALAATSAIVVAHGERRLVHAERERAESAGIEDAGAREHLGVAGARVLRQVAELAGAVDPAVGGQQVAREHLGQGRLAGAVAADETDLVAVADTRNDTSDMRTRAPTRISRSCTASTANVRFVR